MNDASHLDREAMKAHETGSILRHLYIALGIATVANDEELVSLLKPVISRYCERTENEIPLAAVVAAHRCPNCGLGFVGS